MCGINGFVTIKKKDPADHLMTLHMMNQSIMHRGPDAKGDFLQTYKDQTICLGHLRLAIIDLSPAGKQPMSYVFAGKKYTIVFNGEIYNFQTLKNELLQLGYIFVSHSDTEVILASYVERGEDCVNHFNGMRALCLYDEDKQTLFCSRDRAGEKPLYYFRDGKEFIFSSEIKGILAYGVPKIINTQAIDFYLNAGYIHAPLTIYDNIYKLEARYNLRIDLNDFSLTTYPYYTIASYQPVFDKQGLIQEAQTILEDAVKIRLISDVPVGAFLSGGLDSSSIVAQMTQFVDPEKLHTFSIGFEGNFDETKYIDLVKNALHTQHHHSYFYHQNFTILLDTLFQYYDEPFGDPSSFPSVFLSQMTRKYVTVSLSGDGGDEIFGGYPYHQIAAQLAIIKKLPYALKKIIHSITPESSNIFSLFTKMRESMKLGMLPDHQFFSQMLSDHIYLSDYYKQWSEAKLRMLLEVNHGDFVQSIIDYDLYFNTLSDNYLNKVDRATMSVALESRAPFLDVRFMELARQIPSSYKVNRSLTKILMRDMVRNMVPQEIITRRKQGFTPPLSEWILAPEYMKEIKEAVDTLFREKIISAQWHEFYHKKVLQTHYSVYNVFKIKMFMLRRRYKVWMQE